MRIPQYRLSPLLAALLLGACAPSPREFEFPATAGEWKLSGAATAVDAPASISRLGLKTARRAEYQGSGRMTVTVYQMPSSAAALEAEQTWKPVADTVAFHRNTYFLTVRWENVDRGAVTAFVREVEKLAER